MPIPRRQMIEQTLTAALAVASVKNTPFAPESNSEHTVSSPSGSLTATLALQNGVFTYALRDKKNRPLILPSPLGVAFDGPSAPLNGGFGAWKITRARKTISRSRLWSDRNAVKNALSFEQRIVVLSEASAPRRILYVEVRVYDAGLAFRITLPPQPHQNPPAGNTVEKAHFVLPTGAVCYESYASEDEFRPVPVAALKKGNWLPFTVQTAPSGPYLSIAEVDEEINGAGPGMPQTVLSPASPAVPNAVVTNALGTVLVNGETAIVFPWRVIVCGDTPALLAQNALPLVMSLWPASVLPAKEAGWVQPGKSIRETTLSTPGGLACIDFAAQNGLGYILYDAGWYGPENDETSDARAVHLDPTRVGANHPGLDLRKVIAHGKDKGVGVFLYVNRRALEKQLPDLAPLYESWGVAGIKFGFVNTGTGAWQKWMRDSLALCARHHLMVDIHDWYRPVGLSGAYPNLLTQEGIRGNEHMPTPRHNCTLPFTRFLSGPADYTICYRNARLQTTDAHQMALSVLYFSPLQHLFWYGQPKNYENLPELEFFKVVPTVWDEAVWLQGEIGEWAAVARRSGRDWFVGAITNETPRTITLDSSFLPKGVSYTLHSYADKRDTQTQTLKTLTPGVSRIEIKTQTVRRDSPAVSVDLAAAGGITWRLTPL